MRIPVSHHKISREAIRSDLGATRIVKIFKVCGDAANLSLSLKTDSHPNCWTIHYPKFSIAGTCNKCSANNSCIPSPVLASNITHHLQPARQALRLFGTLAFGPRIKTKARGQQGTAWYVDVSFPGICWLGYSHVDFSDFW